MTDLATILADVSEAREILAWSLKNGLGVSWGRARDALEKLDRAETRLKTAAAAVRSPDVGAQPMSFQDAIRQQLAQQQHAVIDRRVEQQQAGQTGNSWAPDYASQQSGNVYLPGYQGSAQSAPGQHPGYASHNAQRASD